MVAKTEYLQVNINEFLKITESGEFDRKETLKHLKSCVKEIVSPDNNKILIDTRHAFPKVHLNVFEIFQSVAQIVKQRTTFDKKIAVLCREDDQIDNAKFFELCAQNRGVNGKAFTKFEEAMNWFAQSSEYSNDSGGSMESVS